jgi:hypothetical protein
MERQTSIRRQRSSGMIELLISALLLLGPVAAPTAQAPANAGNHPSTPAGEYQALVKEHQAAMEEFGNAYQRAKTDADREKVAAKYPQPDKYAPRFLALARKNPKDPAAIDALVWVAVNSRSGAEFDEAMKLLTADYVGSDKLGQVCQSLVYSSSPESEKFLRLVLEKNPNKEVQGMACLSLGQLLKRQSGNEGRSASEAEKLFEQVVAQYGDASSSTGRGTLADAAKAELFELRNLAIGKTAPEIEGEDVDGKKFKLSDYRGKVVVLDFWGDW